MAAIDPRVFLAGTGGQGTLTATRLLAQAALNAGVDVVAGEVHGMAQRGGVVESAVLLGGWRALRLDFGEADILLGFETLETLRALPYLREGGAVLFSDVRLEPLSVCLGQAKYPELAEVLAAVREKAEVCHLVPCLEIGGKIGNMRAGATALLGALAVSGLVPFSLAELEEAVAQQLPAKLHAVNRKALNQGAQWLNNNK